MASYLADTNILLRLADTPSPQNPAAARAVAGLFRERHEVFITAQNIVEFWAVATRPQENNGFGWTCERTRTEVRALRGKFPLLPEGPGIFMQWIRLVETIPVTGKRVHDARLVAVLMTHGVDHLLTFNSGDFALFTDISIVNPSALAATPETFRG
jgi:predicted nucleic acid-binding protein